MDKPPVLYLATERIAELQRLISAVRDRFPNVIVEGSMGFGGTQLFIPGSSGGRLVCGEQAILVVVRA
ncbi:MAG: hypothetical protein COT89_00085 [Candidatus Colwellbacteria bacterium CG10_big_fil_rev_8_21_14_0_10_42_22]|uniref:Uncharacterized protein n=1 Tax=Candidatus Colwellbacteria bacterium CG10_big_fil_rev_8_21_14_0_10_42_22 TaxID=1974540 RepID=A0A2H0VGR8_9BACT|nr:MAG: hypothetical protein COT89_00085 [Candidatus Colwellbacteria bacterium CG10_big_fil_rev_8_21_14_0_10_42_22]